MSRALAPLERLAAINPVQESAVEAVVSADWRDGLLLAVLDQPTPSRTPSRRRSRAVPRISSAGGARRSGMHRARLALLAATAMLALGVATAFAEPAIRGALDHLGSWLAGPPGQPSLAHQERFDRQNAHSYARFPDGTAVGLLLRQSVGSGMLELIGFRAGESLCLRLETSLLPPASRPPECVSVHELERTNQPAAILAGHLPAGLRGGPPRPIVFGLVADGIRQLRIEVDELAEGNAQIGHNAFLYVGPPVEAVSPLGMRSITVVAVDASGAQERFTVPSSPLAPQVALVELLGPTAVDRQLTGSRVGWLERSEVRGDRFEWPAQLSLRIVHARSIQPDPTNPFRVAIADAESTGGATSARFFCMKWLWPLIVDVGSTLCIPSERVSSGLAYTADLPNSGEQFPLWVGVAADEVERLELYYREGGRRNVPVTDNVFAFQTRRGEPVKLVAYDDAGRVVKLGLVGSPESGLAGLAMSP